MLSSLLSYFVLVLGIFFLIVWLYFQYSFSYWKRHGVPCLPPVFPYGNFRNFILQKKDFGYNMKEIYDGLKKDGVKFGGAYVASIPVAFPVDPDLVKNILVRDFNHFVDHGVYVDEEKNPLSGHLFALRGQKWKKVRAKMTQALSSGKLKVMMSHILPASEKLVEVIDENERNCEPTDIRDLMARYLLDVLSSFAFGVVSNSLENPECEFRKMSLRFFEIHNLFDIFRRVAVVTMPKLMVLLNIKYYAGPEADKFFLSLPKDVIEYREKHNIERNDFMQLMLQLKNDGVLKNLEKHEIEGKDFKLKLTYNEIAAQCFVFLVGGYDTTSTTLSFLLYELSLKQDIQEKVREEVLRVIKANNGQLDYDALSELTYLDKAISETLRIYPPLPVVNRECTEDYPVPGTSYTIKKGQKVYIPVVGFQKDPEVFPDPDKFDPERFSEESKASRHPFFHFPFGEGPRGCIGRRMSSVTIKFVVSTLLKRYKITLNPKTKVPVVADPKSLGTITPSSEIWINFEKI